MSYSIILFPNFILQKSFEHPKYLIIFSSCQILLFHVVELNFLNVQIVKFAKSLIIANQSIIIFLVNHLENQLIFQIRNFWNFSNQIAHNDQVQLSRVISEFKFVCCTRKKKKKKEQRKRERESRGIREDHGQISILCTRETSGSSTNRPKGAHLFGSSDCIVWLLRELAPQRKLPATRKRMNGRGGRS